MAKLTRNILAIDYDRRCEIIERAKKIKLLLDSYFYKNRLSSGMGLNFKLEKVYSFYKLSHNNESLNDDEKTILYLYSIFPNDDEFMSILTKHEYDYDKIAKFYDVTVSFLKLRQANLNNMRRLKKDIKTLELKNNN